MRLYLTLALLLVINIMGECKVFSHSGDKPEWVAKGESVVNDKRTNDSYYFKSIVLTGPNLEQLKNDRVNQLSTYIGQSNNITGNAKRDIEQVYTDNGLKSKDSFVLSYQNDINVSKFYARFVDDYWEYVSYPDGSNGYEYYALFAVSQNGYAPNFDSYEYTTSYGFAPVAMSIIPGVGQWYKGSKAKGICMFGAEALAVAGIIVCDNQRASYVKKSKEHPKFAKEYGNKADNWETSRNICIGVAAGVWIYNIIDAAVAKGSRRVVIKNSKGGGLSIVPFAAPTATGMAMNYRF